MILMRNMESVVFCDGGNLVFNLLSFGKSRFRIFVIVLYFSSQFRNLCACYSKCPKLINLHVTSSKSHTVEIWFSFLALNFFIPGMSGHKIMILSINVTNTCNAGIKWQSKVQWGDGASGHCIWFPDCWSLWEVQKYSCSGQQNLSFYK